MAKIFKIFKHGIRLAPIDTALADSSDPSGSFTSPDDEGTLYLFNNKFRIYIESSDREVITNDQTQTIINKTITDTLINLGTASATNKLVLSKNTRAGLDAIAREAGSLYYATDEERYYGDNGEDLINIGSGGLSKVTLFDPVSTVLPTGTSATLDGVAVQDGDLVAFANLTVDDDKVYEASGVGVALAWEAVKLFENGSEDPTSGDLIVMQKGDAFGNQIAQFDGTEWKVNDIIRQFDGANFYEISSLKTYTISGASFTDVFTVSVTGSENMIIDYSLISGSKKETGQLFLTSDGVITDLTRQGANLDLEDIEFESDILTGDVRLRAREKTGGTATMKYTVKRWSDQVGGPTGIPDYSVSGASTIPAAGVPSDIQFHGATGELDADSNFQWDGTNLDMNGLKISPLSASLTVNDNQVTPTPILSIDSTLFKHCVIEYSVVKSGNFRTGRILLTTDGTNIGFSDDFVESSATGVTFSADMDGTNLDLEYISTLSGVSGTFKYSIRKWL